MNTPLPINTPAGGLIVLDLDESGRFVSHITNRTVPDAEVTKYLQARLRIPHDATDIFVWVHGWNNSRERAQNSAAQLFAAVDAQYAATPQQYRRLKGFKPMYVAVRWPSESNPTARGYRKIRERAHAMTTSGYAEFALAQLLGYLDARREPPPTVPGMLRTSGGQYLHCVGHSFGGRFLGEAIAVAPTPQRRLLALLPENKFHRFTVDTFLVFQMAARRDVFAQRFGPMLNQGPLQGPVCLTFSKYDRACSLWHALAERGRLAIGARGAAQPRERIITTRLHSVHEPYARGELVSRIVNIDAGWLYTGNRHRFEGAHSDFWYPASIHLLLTLANYARKSPASPTGSPRTGAPD